MLLLAIRFEDLHLYPESLYETSDLSVQPGLHPANLHLVEAAVLAWAAREREPNQRPNLVHLNPGVNQSVRGRGLRSRSERAQLAYRVALQVDADKHIFLARTALRFSSPDISRSFAIMLERRSPCGWKNGAPREG